MHRFLTLLFLVGAIFTAACRSVAAPREHLVHLQVAADSIDCTGAHGPQRCLEVRELVGGDAWGSWQPLFESIEGFSHEPGFIHDIMVVRREVRDPPADGSSHTLHLVQILGKSARSN